MNLKNLSKLLFLILLFQPVENFGQIQITSVKTSDPIVSEQKLKNFEHFMNLAQEAFKIEDYNQTFYYLKQAEKYGWHNADFWYYLGISVYYRDNKGASKRYLKKGFYDFGCADCNDAYENLFGKRLKF